MSRQQGGSCVGVGVKITHATMLGRKPSSGPQTMPPKSSIQSITSSTEAVDQLSDGHIGNAGKKVGKPGLDFDAV